MSENKYFDSDNFENTDNSVEYEDMQSFEETYERSAEEPSEHTFEEKELEFILKRFERMKVKLMNEIYMLEDENSLGLFLGKCNLCMRCTREFNMPCKMPFKMRYSIESLGGKVDQTVEDIFGYEIKYAKDGKLPEYLIFVGGLLYDKK